MAYPLKPAEFQLAQGMSKAASFHGYNRDYWRQKEFPAEANTLH
jgi:hypothetical protein